MLQGHIGVSAIEQYRARQRADMLEAANVAGLPVAKVSGVAKDKATRAVTEKLEKGEEEIRPDQTQKSSAGRGKRGTPSWCPLCYPQDGEKVA
jgi:hypothetical protein